MDTSQSQKKRLHISLRDLFWLVLVAALALGWWRDRGDLATRNEHLAIKNSQLNWKLDARTFNWRVDEIVPIAGNAASDPAEIED